MGAPATIDLNCDVGEVEGDHDEALLTLVTSAHVACGFHAGGPQLMQRTVDAAAALGVSVGAHPSYFDREGFGRRPLEVSVDTVADQVTYQIGALMAVAQRAGTAVRSVKAHGALYHRLADDEELASALAKVVGSLDGQMVVVLAAGARTRSVFVSEGLAAVAEGFCDRGYRRNGQLADRSLDGAVITDPETAASRAVALATTGRVSTVDGGQLELVCDTLCLHGDGPGALATAGAVRRALEADGVTLAPFVPTR